MTDHSSLITHHSSLPSIGLLGGTFDPPHIGHLHLALELMERCGLSEVWFCPAQANPLKTRQSIASAQHRLEMVQLAIEEFPGFKAIDLELKRPGPSYTIDTVRALLGGETEHSFRLLLGDDAFGSFHLWKEAEELARLAPPIVGLRSRVPIAPVGSPDLIEILCRGEVSIPVMEISATAIRARLAARRPCSHLVPGKVLDFIITHQLY